MVFHSEDNFLEVIKEKISSEVLVLFFLLTPNFYKSPISLCEMGAAWVQSKHHIPIVVPPFKFSDIRGVIPETQGMIINEPSHILELNNSLVKFGLISQGNPNALDRSKSKFINSINEKLDKFPKQERLPSHNENKQEVIEHNNLSSHIYSGSKEHKNTFLQLLNRNKGLGWLEGALDKKPSKLKLMEQIIPMKFDPMPEPGDTFFIALYNDNNEIISRLHRVIEKCNSRKLISEIIYEAKSGGIDYGFCSDEELFSPT